MFSFFHRHGNSKSGFTLIEMMVVLGVLGTLIAFSSVNLVKYQTTNLLQTTLSTVAADIQNQRLKSMNGDTQGRVTTDAYGVYIQSSSYTLFRGASYVAETSGNVTIPMASPMVLSTTFPSNQFVYSKGTGEIASFDSARNTITVRNATTNEQIVLTFNRYGTIISGLP